MGKKEVNWKEVIDKCHKDAEDHKQMIIDYHRKEAEEETKVIMSIEKSKERKLTIEIFYTDNGIQYEDFSYEADDTLEQRDVAFLVACFLKDFILKVDSIVPQGED